MLVKQLDRSNFVLCFLFTWDSASENFEWKKKWNNNIFFCIKLKAYTQSDGKNKETLLLKWNDFDCWYLFRLFIEISLENSHKNLKKNELNRIKRWIHIFEKNLCYNCKWFERKKCGKKETNSWNLLFLLSKLTNSIWKEWMNK